MRSPKDMGIIEIDITNACVHQCANCTRFCGHHAKPFFMGFDTFRRAVDSLDGFEGMVGIIGGEPTLHPEFERFSDYIREKRVGRKLNISRGPIVDMQFHISTTVDKGKSRAVLLSSVSPSYYKNFESINDTYAYQLLNDHSSDSLHQALLMSRKELSIPDGEWVRKRDACWIQNTWSATITPKGAFFCEVAGSFDMLLGGKGGWAVEPGWWKRTPEDFADQIHWCELCSACLDVPKRLSHDERDDVTPQMYERLKAVNSPKVAEGRVVVRNPQEYEHYKEPSFTTGNEYIEAGESIRASSGNRNLYPREILFLGKDSWRGGIKERHPRDWVVLMKGDAWTQEEENAIRHYMENKVWNPGCLYIMDDEIYAFHVKGRSIRDAVAFPAALKENIAAYYEPAKRIHLSMEDPLVAVIGGDSEEALKRGSRKGKRILVYGAGKVGTETICFLKKQGITDFEVAVTKLAEGNTEVMGYQVHEIAGYKERAEDMLVIIAVGSWLHEEMVGILGQYGLTNYRFLA